MGVFYMLKRKSIIAIGVILLAALLLVGYRTWLAPQAKQGAKAVTVEVTIPRAQIEQSFSYQTDLDYVAQLLEQYKADLQLQTQQSSFGAYITAMLGVPADPNKEFYNIKVNGVDASVGISELPLEHGSTYAFTLLEF